MTVFVAFKAQKGTSIRQEKFLGRNHTVVPVVALLEGVFQGLNSVGPELALAEEFGKVPQGWDGRPVVMNHPVIDGNTVSANSPGVLETFAIGRVFNSSVENGKLKMEAWIDTARVAEMSGEAASTLKRLQDGQEVEVSTGFYMDLDSTAGRFNGTDYTGVWRNIVPDHLAMLSQGTKGACSVASGCGAPRSNQQLVFDQSQKDGPAFAILSASEDTEEDEITDLSESEKRTARLIGNAVADGIIDFDARKILRSGLRKLLGTESLYVIGFTTSKAIFEVYDEMNGSFKVFQRSYEVSSDFKVSFGDDQKEVNLFVQIIPAEDSAQRSNKENVMADNANTPAADPAGNTQTPPATPAAPQDNAAPATQEVETPATPATPPTVAAAPVSTRRTMEQYLEEAPEELRETLTTGVQLHQQQKQELITSLKSTGRCNFSDEALAKMPLKDLQSLAELAAVPNYVGRASPRLADNAGNVEEQPAAPLAFPVKPAA